MRYETALLFFGRQIRIAHQQARLIGAIRDLEAQLKHLGEQSNFERWSDPVEISFLDQAVPVPHEALLVSPEMSLLKILRARGCLYMVYEKSVLEVDIQNARARGFFDKAIFDCPRLVSHGFLLTAIIMLLHSRGLYFLHAAALESEDAGFIFVGASGSGKSTNTLNLIENGWRYISDDTIFLEMDKRGAIEVKPIPNEFKFSLDILTKESRKQLLENSFMIDHNDKQFVRVRETLPDQFTSKCIPRVIIHPMIVEEPRSRLVKLSKFETLIELMRESPLLHVKHDSSHDHLNILKQLVNQTQAFRLKAGRDLLHDNGKLSRMLMNSISEEHQYAN